MAGRPVRPRVLWPPVAIGAPSRLAWAARKAVAGAVHSQALLLAAIGVFSSAARCQRIKAVSAGRIVTIRGNVVAELAQLTVLRDDEDFELLSRRRRSVVRGR